MLATAELSITSQTTFGPDMATIVEPFLRQNRETAYQARVPGGYRRKKMSELTGIPPSGADVRTAHAPDMVRQASLRLQPYYALGHDCDDDGVIAISEMARCVSVDAQLEVGKRGIFETLGP
jgi:hypothetical protein